MLLKPVEGKLNIVSANGVQLESVPLSNSNTVVSVPKKQEINIDHSKKEFEERYGFNPPRPVGPNVVIEIYKHEMSEIIEITEQERDRQKWESNVGRVCKIGGACYKGERFKHWPEEELPKVGDWITYKVNAGTVFKYGPPGKGVDVMTIYDDCILNVVENPAYVVRS
jgi:hypothetical protein